MDGAASTGLRSSTMDGGSTPPPVRPTAAEPLAAAEAPAASEARTPRSPGLAERVGAGFLGGLDGLVHVVAVLWRVLLLLPRPSTWPRTTRNVLLRQVLFTGVGALRFGLLVAVLIGAGIVHQVTLWMRSIGQEALVGTVLVGLIVRGLMPLLVNIIVLVRSGSAIVTEMATMKVQGEVRLLEGEGIDPLRYLVIPRVVGVVISVTCLTVLLTATALATGYLLLVALRPDEQISTRFADELLAALSPRAVGFTIALTVVPAVFTGTMCALEGLGVGRAATEVPQAATRGLARSISAVLFSSAILLTVSWL